ncbi:MAG: hypothetical protein Q8Q60_01755 [Candidatus Chromulinivorax sp.]|nr:hypothetical protein [Candidatus Chromulinivorax sp.]
MNKIIFLSLSLLLIGATQFVSASSDLPEAEHSVSESGSKLITWKRDGASVTKLQYEYGDDIILERNGFNTYGGLLIKGNIVNVRNVSHPTAPGMSAPLCDVSKSNFVQILKDLNVDPNTEYKKD